MPNNATGLLDWFGNSLADNLNSRRTLNGTRLYFDDSGKIANIGFDQSFLDRAKSGGLSANNQTWLQNLLKQVYGSANPTQNNPLTQAGTGWDAGTADPFGSNPMTATPDQGGTWAAPQLQNLGFGANPNYQGQATIGTGNSDLLAQRLAKIRGGV